MSKPFAEVVQSSIISSTIQCWHWDEIPDLGSLIIIESLNNRFFGIINSIQRGSSDPGRMPYAYQKTPTELHAEQPQVFQFLQTTCTYIPVGFMEAEAIFYQLPPTPPHIHSFVSEATQEQYQQFFSSEMYVPLLLQQQHLASDELLLALLRKRLQNNALSRNSLLTCIDLFAYHCNDYRNLRLFLQRIEKSPHFNQLP